MNRPNQFSIKILRIFCPPHLLEEIVGDQNFSKNSLGEMMGIFSNGLRTNRSSSFVTMQSDFPDTANSRYMSSLGSRQMTMVRVGLTNSILLAYLEIISRRVSIGLK